MATIARRAGFFVLALWISVTVNFLIPRLMPGDPAAAVFASRANQLSHDPSQLAAIRRVLGLSDEPLLLQYVHYLGDLATGNLGISFSYFPVPVSTVVGQALGWTVLLVGTSAVIAFALGTAVGAMAAWRRGGVANRIVLPLTQVTSNFPFFFLAMILLYVFGLNMGWFPLSHAFTAGTTVTFSLTSIGDVLHHLALPALSLVAVSVGGWMLAMRNIMINTVAEDYVTLARARGLRERRLMLGYAARNALLPQVTGFALSLGYLVGGQVLVEFVFNYPGIGLLLAKAVGTQDYPLIQALLLLVTLGVLLANLAADVVIARLDPRVRIGGQA
jgi:peptide/nickel transport system permease protein